MRLELWTISDRQGRRALGRHAGGLNALGGPRAAKNRLLGVAFNDGRAHISTRRAGFRSWNSMAGTRHQEPTPKPAGWPLPRVFPEFGRRTRQRWLGGSAKALHPDRKPGLQIHLMTSIAPMQVAKSVFGPLRRFLARSLKSAWTGALPIACIRWHGAPFC